MAIRNPNGGWGEGVDAAHRGGDGAVNTSVPTFVYGILVSLFVFYNVFPVNMFLQYKRIGPWRDYPYGERGYVMLSLTAKSLLAWQVFAGMLR